MKDEKSLCFIAKHAFGTIMVRDMIYRPLYDQQHILAENLTMEEAEALMKIVGNRRKDMYERWL